MNLPAKQLPKRLQKKVLTRMEAWLERLEPHTRRSYLRGLEQLGRWLAKPDQAVVQLADDATADDAISAGGAYLLALDGPKATLVVEAWLFDLMHPSDGSPRQTRATASSRLAAVRWALREARRLGQITWSIEAQLPAVRKDKSGRLDEKKGRDMRGPTISEARRLMGEAKKAQDPRAWLIVSLVRYEGFREHEIRQINYEDIDFDRGEVWVVRKKRGEPKAFPLSSSTLKALDCWLEARGKGKGPLLFGGRHGTGEDRIGETTIYRIVRRAGKAAGIPDTSPHRVRHRACTDIVRIATKNGVPEEEILFLTGHSSRMALQPYYEYAKSRKEVREVLEEMSKLEDEEADD